MKRPSLDLSRRRFLAGAAGAASSLILPACGGDPGAASTTTPPPPPPPVLPANPADSGIDHIIVVMMENRSFDHMLGWLPGADGMQAGLTFPDKNGVPVPTYHLTDYQNCTLEDPDHSYNGGHTQYAGGACDGFLKTVSDVTDHFPVGYYTADDLAFFKNAAPEWTVCDRYFPGILSQTFPNRFYMHSGQTDRNTNALTVSTLPTIWDLVLAAGKSAAFYYIDVPFIGLFSADGTSPGKFANITRPFANFLSDAQAGLLPNLAFIDPNFGGSIGEGSGASQDDHPHADIRDGQVFLNKIYDAVRTSPNWEKTLLIINYDEWGGFFDHVPPPAGPISDAEKAITTVNGVPGDGQLGFRVPCLLIGPRARRGHVEHMVFEPNSILDFVRWRFGITDKLSVRSDYVSDSFTVNNLGLALDFVNPPNLAATAYTSVPAWPSQFAQPCTSTVASRMSPAALKAREEHFAEWRGVVELLGQKATEIA